MIEPSLSYKKIIDTTQLARLGDDRHNDEKILITSGPLYDWT